MKGSFSEDPCLAEALFDLLDSVFPGLRESAARIRALGVRWESVSIPFVRLEGGRVVSHVGLIELPLVLLGKEVPVGSIHAVATAPECRRRGHYRGLIEEALSYCAGRYETVILTTGHPDYFEPFGFRYIREHLASVRFNWTGGGAGLRLINPDDEADINLLNRLLESRAPVSRVVGVVKEKAVFCFGEGHHPLHYAKDLDAIVCLEIEGKRLKLFDVVAPRLPTLRALLEKIPQPIEEVAMHFAADRFVSDADVTPYLLDHDGPSYLMVRGPFAAEGQPFTLPRSART